MPPSAPGKDQELFDMNSSGNKLRETTQSVIGKWVWESRLLGFISGFTMESTVWPWPSLPICKWRAAILVFRVLRSLGIIQAMRGESGLFGLFSLCIYGGTWARFRISITNGGSGAMEWALCPGAISAPYPLSILSSPGTLHPRWHKTESKGKVGAEI